MVSWILWFHRFRGLISFIDFVVLCSHWFLQVSWLGRFRVWFQKFHGVICFVVLYFP